jgi:hypothetical protein
MVDRPLATQAVVLARQHPQLGIGLHFAVTSEDGPLCDLTYTAAIEKELERQYRRCCDLLGQAPTHIDSHHHVHTRKELAPLFRAWAAEQRLPLRNAGPVLYNGGFYGQWYDDEWQPHPALELIGVDNLIRILRTLPKGITELACHPGYPSADLHSSYATEREIELATLLNSHVLTVIHELGITLTNFAALPKLLGGQDADTRSLT